MSNYKITSADFVTPGEALEPDAYMSAEDLANIKHDSELKAFLHQRIIDRMANNIELPEGNTIIIRERKYDNDN